MITKIILISTCTLAMSINTKSGYISDPNDTTSWNNAYVLSADTAYNAILKDSDDEDFYRFSPSCLRSIAIRVSCSNQNATINVYKNSTSNLVATYLSNVTIDYSNFSDKLVAGGSSDTIYIKVSSSITASYYTIAADTNPNLSGISIFRSANGSDPTHYFNVSPHPSVITYYIDPDCFFTSAGYPAKTFANAFTDAIGEWNKLGQLSLNTTATESNANVKLYARDSSYFSGNQITDHDATIVTSWFFGTTHKFNCTYGSILNTVSTYGPSGSYSTYLSIVQTCINLIGCTFGLSYSTKEQNFMYDPVSASTIFPYNNIGDGDVSSYLYIYG